MAKPICLIKVDNGKGNYLSLGEMQQNIAREMAGYHIIVIPFEQPDNELLEPIQLQVFYEKDFTEIHYEELKKLIESYVKNEKGPTAPQADEQV